MLKKLFSNPIYLIFETFYLIGLPLTLLLLNPWLLPFRIPVIASGLIYIYFVMKITGLTLKDIGVSKQDFMDSVKFTFLPTLAVCTGFYVLSIFYPDLYNFQELVNEANKIPYQVAILLYILISVPLQEFVFRGFYIARLELVSKNKLFLVVYSSAVFAIIHIAFQNKLMLPLAFLLGLYLSRLFLRFRNLAGTVFSHAVVGAVLLWLVFK